MDKSKEKLDIRMLALIIGNKDVKKAAEILQSHHAPIQYVCTGEGTASSEIMEYLGLGITEKAIVTGFVAKHLVSELFESLNHGLSLHKPNKGIAFTFPITGGSSFIMRLINEETKQLIMEHLERSANQVTNEAAHSLLLITINQGYSEEVMSAAKAAGATGGTIVRARRVGLEEPLKRWGVSIQPEKEMIYILTDQEKKHAIMKAIGDHCGIHTDAQGIVVSIPVDEVTGMTPQTSHDQNI